MKNNLCLCIWQRNPRFNTYRWSASAIFLFIICKCNEWTEKRNECIPQTTRLCKNIIKMKYENLNFPHTQINKTKMHWQRNLIVRILSFFVCYKNLPQKIFSIFHFIKFAKIYLFMVNFFAIKISLFFFMKFDNFSKDIIWCPLVPLFWNFIIIELFTFNQFL